MQWCFGHFRIDVLNMCLWCDTQRVSVRPKTFDVLVYLLSHAGELVRKADLLDAVWPETEVGDAVLKVSIRELRQALGDSAKSPQYIATVARRGYRFIAEVELIPEADTTASEATPVVAVRPFSVCPGCQRTNSPNASCCKACGAPFNVDTPLTESVMLPLEAERRQLTVLYCDLVRSSALLDQFDPEAIRDLFQMYQQTCAEVIQRYDGYVVHYMGDGLLVYFGHPQAHEDDAQRAVWAGLGIINALHTLNARVEGAYGVQLSVRISIHTGLVVVGGEGVEGPQEHVAFGAAPNIAAWILRLAHPNEVVLTEETRRLAGREFAYESLGVKTLQGIKKSLHVYRVVGKPQHVSRFEATFGPKLTPFIGREEELALFSRRWEQTQEGEGQAIVISGEAGIGKSRLVHTLRKQIASKPHICMQYQCSPFHCNSPFYPFIRQFEQAAQFVRDDTATDKLTKLEAFFSRSTKALHEAVPLVASLLSIPVQDRYADLSLSSEQQRSRTISLLAEHLIGLARHQPLLLIMEDVHWSDPTTLEVLDAVIYRARGVSILMILTARPEFDAPKQLETQCSVLTLNRLSQFQSVAMVEQLSAGVELDPETRDDIILKTDGIPLFIEEVTQSIVETSMLGEGTDRAGGIRSFHLEIPLTIQGLLLSRLDQLGPIKEVAQWGAALGREFTYELLAAVSEWNESDLQYALDQLVRSGLLLRSGHPPESSYRFKHALIQDSAYGSLLKRKRQRLHARIAQVIEEHFPTLVKTEPELLAHHSIETGRREQAIDYWHKAGERAIQRSANIEAIAHLRQGLAVLKTLPETPARHQQELNLLTTLGPALMATEGYNSPKAESTYRRAHELCQQADAGPCLFAVQRGLWSYYSVRGESQTAHTLAKQCLDLAKLGDETLLVVEAHMMLGTTLMFRGELISALAHLQQGVELYDAQPQRFPPFLQDAGVGCRCYAAIALWHLGYPDQARTRSYEALALAQDLAHPFSIMFSHYYLARVSWLLQESQTTKQQAEAAVSSAIEQGFRFVEAGGTMLLGWALTQHGDEAAGIAHIRHGLAHWRGDGVGSDLSPWFALLANAYENVGQAEEGLEAVEDALALVDEHSIYTAGLYRLKGELLIQWSPDDQAEAEICFQKALDIALHQQAKSCELRAATSLARLWQAQGKRQDAYDLLAPVYGWFTEGFDTTDLQNAKSLLDELER